MQRIAVGLSDRVNALTSQNVLVVDLLCDPRVYEPGSFYTDGFHPSDRGYAVMAELTYPRLSSGTGASALVFVRPAHAAAASSEPGQRRLASAGPADAIGCGISDRICTAHPGISSD